MPEHIAEHFCTTKIVKDNTQHITRTISVSVYQLSNELVKVSRKVRILAYMLLKPSL